MQLFLILLSHICLIWATDPFQTYKLSNDNGLEVWFIPFGATMTHLYFTDSTGVPRDIILGFDDPHLYRDLPVHPYFGAIIGRYANRIANGSFTHNDFVYHVPLNDNNWDTLHGGDIGYDRRIWNVLESNKTRIVFQLYDGDLVESFPGALNVTITYQVNNDNQIVLDYHATTDTSTIINLSLHTYWNLNAFKDNSQNVLDHVLLIEASNYTPVDSHLIPTGEIASVTTAPWLDFLTPKAIGKDIAHGTVTPTGGYDNNLVLDKSGLTAPAAQVYGPQTGIQLDIYTTQPGLQFYSGNFLDGTIPRKSDQIYDNAPNQAYQKYSAFVLETQHFPDSVHHPDWPTTVINSGDVYHHTTIFALYNK